MWTNTSLPPSSGCIKPYPLSGLNHFTVPVVIEAILRIVEEEKAPAQYGRPLCIEVLWRRSSADAKMRGQAVGKNTTPYNVCFYCEQNKGVSPVFERGRIALACSIFLDHGP